MASAERELARALLERESGGASGTAGELAVAAEHVCGKLRLHLARVVGSAGFEAILRRALTLARREYPTLAAVEVQPDDPSCLTGLREALAERPPDEAAEALTVLLAAFLGLLIDLVGNDLAARLLTPVWRDAAQPDQSSDTGSHDQGEVHHG